MSDEPKKSVVNFCIDDTPVESTNSFDFEDSYSLDFHSFLEQSAYEQTLDDTPTTNSVKKAGRNLRKKQGDLKSATSIIQRFRAAHEKPLNTISYLIGRCCRELEISVKPVKRLKRLDTIIDKLQRKSLDGKTENKTCVTNMNDIGGCRAIFPDIESLNKVRVQLTKVIEGEPRVVIKDIDDYIEHSKENDCGYRSLHIIYQYENSKGKKLKIEAQLRTRLQHLWATTVEIVDILERTNIKTHSHASNDQKEKKQIDWEELLSIMSKIIADSESIIKLTLSEKKDFSQRLQVLDKELNAVNRLKSFNMMTEELAFNQKDCHVLLVIDETAPQVLFQKVYEQQAEAIAAYNEVEKIIANLDGLNSLLVSSKNLDQLGDAYPNYMGDCASFIQLLLAAMEEPSE